MLAPTDPRPISTDAAPAAVGPYSQAVQSGELIFVSGQLPIDPATGALVSDDPVAQLRQCLANISAIAAAAGTDLTHTVKTTIMLTDLSGFEAMNEAYAAVFADFHPARSTYEVSALPKGAKVEVDAVIAGAGGTSK